MVFCLTYHESSDENPLWPRPNDYRHPHFQRREKDIGTKIVDTRLVGIEISLQNLCRKKDIWATEGKRIRIYEDVF